jgi:hypothetical protein
MIPVGRPGARSAASVEHDLLGSPKVAGLVEGYEVRGAEQLDDGDRP